MTDIDRFDAEALADLLNVPVEVIPEDSDSLTRQLWDVLLGEVPMPEDIDIRWQFILQTYLGIGLLP
jgi:hypothetical protein